MKSILFALQDPAAEDDGGEGVGAEVVGGGAAAAAGGGGGGGGGGGAGNAAARGGGAAGGVVETGVDGSPEHDLEAGKFMTEFFADIDDVKASIREVHEATEHIKKLQDKHVTAVGAEQESALSEELDEVLVSANRHCGSAKVALERLKVETDEMDPSTQQAEIRIRQNMHATVSQNLIQTVRAYQQAQQTYKTKIKEKVTRQILVVKPDATMEEIRMVERSGDTGAIYRAAILQPGSNPIAQAYINVADKYQDVIKLEKSVEELHQMFLDLAVLVEMQGEMLDQVEFQVNASRDYVERGNRELKKALKARKAMRRKMCCLGILLIIILCVLFPDGFYHLIALLGSQFLGCLTHPRTTAHRAIILGPVLQTFT